MPDEIQVKAASRTLSRMAADPITWIPFLPFAAAYSFLGTPWWACAVGAAVAGAGIVAWWRRHWGAIYVGAEVSILKEQAKTDNARIEKSVADSSRRLIAKREEDLVRRLPDFLTSKQIIDTSIFEDDRVTPVEAEIATMVADLSRAWLTDLEKLAGGAPGEAEYQRLRQAVLKGLAVMAKTRGEIDTLIRPSYGLDPVVESVAADRAQRLEDRLDEARNIRDRLSRDLKSAEVTEGQEPGRITQ